MTDRGGEHRDAVEAWRDERYERLRSETGWLTLAGLGWLKPGANRLGSAPEADVLLPSGPPYAGTVTVGEARSPTAAGTFTLGGESVRTVELTSDAEGEPTLLELGPLRLCLIDRGGRLAIRTWDTEAPALTEFNGIDHWPVDPAWRVTARLEPTPGRMVDVPDVFGAVDPEESPGDLAFEIDGRTYRVQAVPGGDGGELWLIFGDATNGHETYGGGRYLYTAPPDVDGSVVVDFNCAYNPPCVFTPFATCPLPWPANRLPIRIEAGERAWSHTIPRLTNRTVAPATSAEWSPRPRT